MLSSVSSNAAVTVAHILEDSNGTILKNWALTVVSDIPTNSMEAVAEVVDDDENHFHYIDVVRNGAGNCLDQCRNLRSQCMFQYQMD